MDEGYFERLRQIESTNDYNNYNKKSGAWGAYQFIPKTARKYGLERGKSTPADQDRAARQFTQDNYNALKRSLGREPEGWELYVSHNQGCFKKGTEVIMGDGAVKAVEEVEIGDVLANNGKNNKVVSLCRGKEEMYVVKSRRYPEFVVNASHILYVRNGDNGKYLAISVKDFVDSSKWKKRILGIVPFRGYEGKEIDLQIDPYYLGIWLGDGTTKSPNVITNGDAEIVDWIRRFVKENNYDYSSHIPDGKKSIRHRIKTIDGRRKTGLPEKFRKIGLDGKYIPEIYFQASRRQRLELLAGLLDTDGTLSKKDDSLIFNQGHNHLKLIKQTKRLCISLGFIPSIGIVRDYSAKGLEKQTTFAISGKITEIPIKVNRKKPIKDTFISHSTMTIEPIGVDDYYGFELDGDHLFSLANGVITHNSTGFSNLMKTDRNAPLTHNQAVNNPDGKNIKTNGQWLDAWKNKFNGGTSGVKPMAYVPENRTQESEFISNKASDPIFEIIEKERRGNPWPVKKEKEKDQSPDEASIQVLEPVKYAKTDEQTPLLFDKFFVENPFLKILRGLG